VAKLKRITSRSAAYAYIAPRLRSYRLLSLEQDLFTLRGYVSDLKAFLQVLRTTSIAPYLPEEEPGLADAELAAWRMYADILSELAPIIPPDADPIHNFYYVYTISRDLMLIGKTALQRGRVAELEELIAPESPEVGRVFERAVEAGFIGFMEGLREIGFREAVRLLEEAEASTPGIVDLALDVEVLGAVREARKRVGGLAASILCPRMDIVALRTVSNVMSQKLPEAALNVLRSKFACCRLPRDQLVSAFSWQDLSSLAALLRETPYGTASGEAYEALSEQYELIRRASRRRLLGGLAASPFDPATIAAMLELLLLDIEDLSILLVAAYTGNEELAERITVA